MLLQNVFMSDFSPIVALYFTAFQYLQILLLYFI